MRYFATLETTEIAKEIQSKVDDYREYLRDSGTVRQLRASYNAFYPKASSIEDGGEYGEYAIISANEYGNLVRHLKSMVASSKPAWDARAANSDSKSLQSAQLANSVLDYVMTERRCERQLLAALEIGLTLREAFLLVEWDSSQGGEVAVDPESGFPVMSGDIQLSCHNMLDVARDFTCDRFEDCNWLIVSERKNKYEMAARFQHISEAILAATAPDRTKYALDSRDEVRKQKDSDLIEVHTLIHDRTAAMPDGRMTIVVADAVAFDGPLPYSKMPVVRLTPEEKSGTCFGWSWLLDLLPLQEANDIMLSTVVSNNRAFGTQAILAPKGSGLSVQEIGEGMNLIEYDPAMAPPSPMQLTASAPETYQLMNSINTTMERLSGVSQIARGSAPISQLSGSAMALLQSQSIQFASSINQAYTAALEDVGTLVVQHYQRFAMAPRVVQLAGKSGRNLVREFKGEDLQGINRVQVSSGNPLSKTLAGRLEVAKDLLANQLVKTPQEYLQVLTTGTLQPLIEGDVAVLNLIRSENEDMAEGTLPAALVTDRHDLHVQEHMTVLSSPEARRNPAIVDVALRHIQEHFDLWRTADPLMLQLSGTPPPPPPMAPPAGAEQVNSTVPPQVADAAQINEPNLPVNPLSGGQFDPATGGL